MPTDAIEDFLKTTGALYDETRIKLLKFIALHGPVCVCELQQAFGMGQSRLSRHLKILKEAGFLTLQRQGRWSYYRIREPLDRFRASAVAEIGYLPIELPKPSQGCDR